MSLSGYFDKLAARFFETIEEKAIALYVGGSYCQGDFGPNSDLDVYAFCSSSLPPQKTSELARIVSNESLAVPAKGIEFHLLRHPVRVTREPEFLMVLSDGKNWPFEVENHYAVGENLIGLSIVKSNGILVRGDDLCKTLPDIPRRWLLEEVRKVVVWHKSKIHDEFHDPLGYQAVLNACRALCYTRSENFLSKSEGAEWFLRNFSEYNDLVAGAIESRKTSLKKFSKKDILNFLSFVEQEM